MGKRSTNKLHVHVHITCSLVVSILQQKGNACTIHVYVLSVLGIEVQVDNDFSSFHFSLCIHVQFVCFLTNSPCNTLLSAAILKPFFNHWMVSYIIHSLISKKPMIMPNSNTHEHIPKWFLQSAVHLFVPVLGQDGLWPEQNTTYQ